jgi:hypothetical protein
MIKATKALFGDGHHLWQANKSFRERPFGPNAVRLPNKPHGLNTYADVHDIAFLAALNPTTDHFRFLESQGLSGGDVRRCTYFAGAYQGVMRTSIRNPDNLDPKRILVPDLGLAEYLQRLFPGSRIERLDIGLPKVITKKAGRPRRHRSGRDRTAEFRRKARDKRLRLLNDLLLLRFGQDTQDRKCCNETSNKVFTDSVTQLSVGTLYSGKRSPTPAGFLNCRDEDEFVAFLRDCHQRHVTDKESDLLVSPAVFDPDRVAGTSRGIGNIVYMRHLWFDFEDGDLRPQDLVELFPNIRMAVMNTFHHTTEKPRFRVVIPTTQIVTAEAHSRLYAEIAAKLEDAGYEVPQWREGGRGRKFTHQSGLDWSKSYPHSIFYLPSQAQDPAQSFFVDYAGEGRAVLDPLLWVENSVVPPQPEVEAGFERLPHSNEVNEAMVQAATANWRGSKAHPGEGNQRFFEFALALRRAGVGIHDIGARISDIGTERPCQSPRSMSAYWGEADSMRTCRYF